MHLYSLKYYNFHDIRIMNDTSWQIGLLNKYDASLMDAKYLNMSRFCKPLRSFSHYNFDIVLSRLSYCILEFILLKFTA